MHDTFTLDTSHWYVVRLAFLVAGLIMIASAALALLVSVWWVLLGGFVGLMLVSFASTGYCPGAILMAKAGVPRA